MSTSRKNCLLVCRGCLQSDGKLFNIDAKNLSTAYSKLTGIKVLKYDKLPKYLCYMCSALLLKYSAFKEMCWSSKRVLENKELQCSENPNILHDIYKSLTPYKYAPITTLEYQPEENNEVKTEILTDDKHTINIPSNCIDNNIDVKVEAEIEIEIKDKLIKTEDIVCDDLDEMPLSDMKLIKIDEDIKPQDFKDNSIQNSSSEKNISKIVQNNTKPSKVSKVDKNSIENWIKVKNKLSNVEAMSDVDIILLSREEIIRDMVKRRESGNYMRSPYKCDSCYKGFMDEDNLKRHFMTQHDPSRGKAMCEFCKFRYKDTRGLQQHLKAHRLKFACKLCKHISRSTFNAKEHHKTHIGQTLKCVDCGKTSKQLSSHLSHVRRHHPSQLTWCQLCGEAFVGLFGLNSHKKRAHKDLKFPAEALCKDCNANFTNVQALQIHTHRRSDGVCDTIICVHCGLGFDAQLELKDHLLDVHRTVKKYCCEMCPKTFAKEASYSVHYQERHVISSQKSKDQKLKNYVCEICGESFKKQCLLVYHQRNHSDDKPYQCSECPKMFTMKKLLCSHMRIHTSLRPFACGLCRKTFKRLPALRSHENVHLGCKSKDF